MNAKLLALAAALLLSTAPVRAAEPYDVYVLLPLTGYGAFFAVPQQQALRAIEGIVNESGGIGGRPVRFVVQDDQTNPQIDVQLTDQIIAKHVPVMLGPDTTGQCNAVMPLLKSGPVTFCFTTGVHPAPGGYAFASGASTEYIMEACFHYLSARGLKRIAVITSTDATGQDADRMIEATAARHKDVAIVARQYFNNTDVSVAAQMTRIKAARPDVLVVWSTGTPFGTVLRGVRDAGLEVPVLSGSGNLLYQELKQYKQLLPKELLFPGSPYLDARTITDKATRAAVDRMDAALAKIGVKADQGHNTVWDAVMIMMAALKKLGPNATATQVRDEIANLKGWTGIDGRYDFKAEPQRGLQRRFVVMVRFDAANNRFVALSKPGGDPLPSHVTHR